MQMIWISWLMLGMLIGLLIGQLSVYRHLRKKGRTVVGGWIYTANRCTEDYTCVDCIARFQCPAAWDEYNTGGDCIMEK